MPTIHIKARIATPNTIKQCNYHISNIAIQSSSVCLLVSIHIIQSMNIEDSLDNLSALHLSQQRSLLAQVKQKFVIALQKLQSAETREIGIGELRKLIDNYREADHLRNYIAILKALKPSPNSATKEHEILVISILATTFKTQLIDPLDKPPSLLKTVFRMVQVLHGYFADRSATVQQACARALLDLSSYCLGSQDTDSIYSIIYSPLISILKSGVDKGSQATAAACLNELISNCRRINNQDMLSRLAPQLLAVILKVNCEYHELFQAVSSMLEVKGLAFLQGRVVTFLGKVLSVINATRELPNAGNLNSYMCKVHVCKIIERLGVLLPSTEKDKLIDLNVQEALVQASRNRIIQVQLAASRALRAWKGEQVVSPPKNGLMSLQEKRNNKIRERSRSKDEQEKLEKQLTFMKEDLEKLVKGGWGANNRAKNYVKRGSGVGGGSHGKNELSPPSRGSGKSHKEHFEELRQYIKKGAEQNKHLDRFSLPNLQAKRGRSPPPEAKRQASAEMGEFQMQADEGDQMVMFENPKKKTRTPQSRQGRGVLAEAGISQQQANQLMNHEKTLMDQGAGMNINYYTEKSQSKMSRKDSKNSSDKDSLEEKKKPVITQTFAKPTREELNIPLAPNNQSSPTLQNNKNYRQPERLLEPQTKKSNIISQQEIGDLVEEYNLSQISQNLDGILNESDLHMIQETTPNQSVENGRSDIQEIREKLAEKKARQSIVQKFFKKESPPPEQVIVNPVPLLQQPQHVASPPTSSPPLPPQVQPITNSLNFTQSLVSRNKSREEIQFTLNPKDRFSSLRPEPKSQEKQIQQQIVMSEYEESMPKGQKLPTFKDSRQAKPTKEQSPQAQIEYQQLIKNPPRRQAQSIKSRSEKDTSEYNVPVQAETVDLGKEWLKILTFLQEGNLNQAFESALSLDDPIYLLRLMLISKCPLRKLTAATVQHLWSKFLEIYSHRFIDVLTVGVLGEAQELGLLSRCLSLEELEEALIGLYELAGMTKGKLSYSAASLYNTIERSLHPQ